MVFSFTHIEGAGEDGIAAGVRIDHGNVPALREIDRVVGLLIGRDAEDHSEHVVAAGEIFERDADIVAGVEFEIEAEDGFNGSNRAGDVFANLPCFEDCRVGSEEPDCAAGSCGRHEHLGGKTTACHHARTSEELRLPHSPLREILGTITIFGQHLRYQCFNHTVALFKVLCRKLFRL